MSETFDPTEALDRLAGDGELLREVVELVHEEWLRQAEALAAALGRSDAAAVAAAAHSLKGAVGQLGSEEIAAAAAQVERAARGGDLAGAETFWKSASPRIEELIAAARQWAAAPQ